MSPAWTSCVSTSEPSYLPGALLLSRISTIASPVPSAALITLILSSPLASSSSAPGHHSGGQRRLRYHLLQPSKFSLANRLPLYQPVALRRRRVVLNSITVPSR